MGGKPLHKSIYLPPDLSAKLEAHKAAGHDINFSRTCRAAIEKALDETDEDGINVGTVLRQLRNREEEIRQLKAVLQGLVRHAASHCGMTILSEKDEKAFRAVFENGVESFIYQTKKQAIEEYTGTKKRKRQQKATKNKPKIKATITSTSKAARITIEETIETKPTALPSRDAKVEIVDTPPPAPNPTLEPLCAICLENNGDITCEHCSNMICWYCWGKMDETNQPKLCTSCKEKGEKT